MTETSRCLDSHPKFLCTVGASIFGLQAHSIQQTFPWSRKFQRQFSHFLLCPAECLADSHESGTPKDHLTFRQVQQSSLCGFFVSSLCISPGKSSFLPKWLSNSITILFDAHPPLEVDWCCQEQTCLIVMKNPKLLKHLNAIFCRLWKKWRMHYLKYIYAPLKNLTNMTTSLTIIDDYPLTTYICYIFKWTAQSQYLIKIRNTYTCNKIDLKIHTNANFLYLYHISL